MSEETKQEKPQEVVKRDPIVCDESGEFLPATLDDALRVAKVYTVSNMLPKQYDTVEKVIVGMQYARELGFKGKTLTAMRQIAVVHGTPSIWGDLPLALAWRSGVLQAIEEFYVDREGNQITLANKNLSAEAFAAVCRVKRNDQWFESIFTLDDARKAHLLPARKSDGTPNPAAPWERYPKRMLRYRARSQCLKDAVPDALMGIAIAEYDFNALPEEGDFGEDHPREQGKQAASVAAIVKGAIDERRREAPAGSV